MKKDKKKYFIKFSSLWYLTMFVMLGLPKDFDFKYYPYVIILLIILPHLIMNVQLYKVLQIHMSNKVVENKVTHINAVKKSNQLGLQNEYCRQVKFWLNISWIALLANMLINFTDYTRWNW